MKNYYEILGVSPTISHQGLKDKFRHMMFEYHPDVAVRLDAEERYGEVMEAYRTLIDVNTRMTYDLSNGFPGPESRPHRPKPETPASAQRKPEMTTEERRKELEKLLEEKRAKEERRGFFTFGGYFGRLKLWVVFIVLSIVVPAASVALEFFYYLNTSTRKLDAENAGVLSAAAAVAILIVFLILRAIMLSFRYRPSKTILWELSFIFSCAYAYAMFYLGENFNYRSYFTSLIDMDSIIGVAIFTLLFAAGLFSVENKNMFSK
ncbi:hypothetical protein AGMMS50276_19210 [Synergistales bacterium]|nr:hypothetical protein AGMMS50276_19210 [Synergistales bacterium]